MVLRGNLIIPAPHGSLEAMHRPGRIEAGRVALVLHPHPLHGGTMHNRVVVRTARALEGAGFETLRFNFRGVGRSTGSFDGGRGEEEDAASALEYLLAQGHAGEVIVAGFSFGAAVGLRFGCVHPRVSRMIGIGTPAAAIDLDLVRRCAKPKIFIHGTRDDIVPFAPLKAFVCALPEDQENVLIPIEGAGHFFDDGLDQLARAICDSVGG